MNLYRHLREEKDRLTEEIQTFKKRIEKGRTEVEGTMQCLKNNEEDIKEIERLLALHEPPKKKETDDDQEKEASEEESQEEESQEEESQEEESQD